jgi:hypothetical protein
VLFDLVPKPCYDTWVSLSNLILLIWQPIIPDINKHIGLIDTAIDDFLIRTARWTPRWFNKPKFHIILHLGSHIRCFGPASLFATEAFELFNAVIQAKSIHSNRLVPSWDIASTFAHGNRICHLLSGARALLHSVQLPDNRTNPPSISRPASNQDANIIDAREAGLWHLVGPGPLRLVQ